MKKGATRSILLIFVLLLGLYIASFFVIKLAKPISLTTNDGPGRFYCKTYWPLRFLVASLKGDYWRSASRNHWQTVAYLGFNPGSGYIDVQDLAGRPGRAWSGRDLAGVSEGDWIDIHLTHRLETWDDFSDHLVPRVDDSRHSASE